MGKSLFIVLAVCIMSSGVRGQSQSMSCSTVNGITICDKQSSSGNTAMASSSSFSGPQGSSQDTYAGAGNPGDWESSGQSVRTGDGGRPPSNDYFDFDRREFQGPPRGFDGPVDGGCSYSSSGSAKNFGTDAGPTTVVGGFGFASAGNDFRPRFPNFAPQTVNAPQDSSVPNGGLPVNNNFRNDNSGVQVSTGGFGGPPVNKNFRNDNSGFQVSTGGAPVNKNFRNDNSGFQVSTGGFAGGPSNGGMSYSYVSSGSAPNFGTNVGTMSTAGGFAGGPSVGGMSYSYSSSGSAPNFGTNQGPMPTAGGFGFASAGNVNPPGFPFNYVSGFVNGPRQDSSRPNGGGFPGGYAGGNPGGFAGGYAGGFAGAGNFGPPGQFDPFRFVFGRR